MGVTPDDEDGEDDEATSHSGGSLPDVFAESA
jgi:hypothetical protein